MGTLHLAVPQARDGGFSTTLFGRYQRSEKALVLTLIEMVVNGVSTALASVRAPKRVILLDSMRSTRQSARQSNFTDKFGLDPLDAFDPLPQDATMMVTGSLLRVYTHMDLSGFTEYLPALKVTFKCDVINATG